MLQAAEVSPPGVKTARVLPTHANELAVSQFILSRTSTATVLAQRPPNPRLEYKGCFWSRSLPLFEPENAAKLELAWLLRTRGPDSVRQADPLASMVV